MRQTVNNGLDMSITITSPLSPRRAEKLEEKRSTQPVLSPDIREQTSGNELSTEAKVEDSEVHQLKLPVLPTTRRINNEENSNLQVLLRGVQCFDFSLHELTAWSESSTKKSPPTCTRRPEVTSNIPEITQELMPFVSDQNLENNSEGELESARESLKDKTQSALPFFGSILEGQRVNLREKVGFNKQRKQVHCQMTERRTKLSNQSYSTYEGSDIENILTRRTSSNTVSLKTGKQGARAVFHLPKADKYDITPRNIINSKVCSVFKMNDLRSPSFYYSGYKNTWIPRRDSYVIKNSVFNAIAQQPTVFLRQPSPVAGVKMTLKEHEDSLAAAIQAVEETNARSPSVDAEVSRQVKKFVIRLPPIC
ncbi:uncharacterized protein LOC144645676 [Oculina patagonica]